MSLMGLLWQIRYKYEDYYFKHRYRDREVKIYYDKKMNQYVNPKILEERSSSLIYVCSEIARDSLYYGYIIDNKHHHAHTIDEVFEDAYNHGETFEIEDEEAFSQQEIRMIYKLVQKGIEDRGGGEKMEAEPSTESENDGKSVNNDSIVRIVEKINWEYSETLKRLAEIERQERENKGNDEV